MKITVFTGNQPRHLSLIRDLASIADEVYAVMEVTTLFPGKREDFFKKSDVMQEYFSHVMESEKSIFGTISLLPNNVRPFIMKTGDLNDVSMDILAPALQSDHYVVFGASYIKGDLIDFLVQHRAYNIHMGISPYYRGSSCNFWAAYDGNIDLVGATIHLLSKGLDSGDMFFHALPKVTENPFDLGMRAVQSAHKGLMTYLKEGRLKKMTPIPQDPRLEIRYTRNSDFTDDVARDYLNKLPSQAAIRAAVSGAVLSKFLNPFVY